jgi:hypothetical protein
MFILDPLALVTLSTIALMLTSLDSVAKMETWNGCVCVHIDI